MLSSFLTTIGGLVANKKVVGSWLVLLSLSTAQIADKVYIHRTEELTRVESSLENIQKTLDKMDGTLEKNGEKLTKVLEEQARVRAELDMIKARVK